MSHPTWVRGLKLLYHVIEQSNAHVAPYVGAWIETDGIYTVHRSAEVAPYVGAWIETDGIYTVHRSAEVAPYVGAWIETIPIQVRSYRKQSHPTWVRGLKPAYELQSVLSRWSHPTWVRGLKRGLVRGLV